MYLIRAIYFVLALLVIHSCARLPARTGIYPIPESDRKGSYPMPESARKAWGCIDRSGRYVIAPQFHSAHDFSCGAAAVALDKERYTDYNDLQYDYIDKTGKVISHDWQSREQQLHCGLCPRKGESAWGYVNAQGTFKIAPRFEEALEFTNGLAPVTEHGHLEIIDTKGKIVWSESTAKPLGSAADENGYVVIELGGPAFFAWSQNHRLRFGGWFAADEELAPADSEPLQTCYGYLDRKGQWVIPPKFCQAGHFSEGLAAVTERSAATNWEWCEYFIDKTGKTALNLPKSARGVGDFHEGIAWVCLNDSDPPCALSTKVASTACGFINKSGKFVIRPKYTMLSRSFSEGLAAASIGSGENERWGFIDKKEHVVVPFVFGYVGDFSEGLAAVFPAKGRPASVTSPSALEIDRQIRQRILQICRPYKFSSFQIQLNISNGSLGSVELRKSTGNTSLDAKLTAALRHLKLPPWSPELRPENSPTYVVTPAAVFASSTSEDPDKPRIDKANKLRDQLSLLQEHADWKNRQTLLEQYLSLIMGTDDDSWSPECSELIRLYRQRGDLKKARRLAESAYKLSVKHGWELAEIAEEGGDPSRAESIIKQDIARFQKENQGKLLQTNVRPWSVTGIVQLADLYYRQKRFNDAEGLYKKLADEHPYSLSESGEKIDVPNLEDRYRLAVFYLDRGKIEVAEKLFAQVLKDANIAIKSASVEDDYLGYLTLLKERYPERFEKFQYLAEQTLSSADTALWGAIDKSGHFTVQPKFDGLGWFDEGLAPAKLGHRWGYIDTSGKWKILPQFAVAMPFSEELAAVARRFQSFPLGSLDKSFEKLSFIDKDGVCQLRSKQDFGIDSGTVFSEGLAGVALDTGVNDYGYIDKSGNIVIAGQFHEVPQFKNGIARPSIALPPLTVTPGGLGAEQYEVLISKNRPMLRPRFDKPARSATDSELINPFAITNGDICSCLNDGINNGARKWGYQAIDGTVVIQPTFDQARCYSESVAAVRLKEHWGYVDKRGKFVLAPIYDSANDFIDGLAIVSDHDKTHFIDHCGRDPFDGKYDSVKPFSAGRAAVSTNGGIDYSLVDRQGRQVTDIKFRHVGPFASGLAPAQLAKGDSNQWGYIDLNGNFAIPPIFEQAQEFHGDLAVVRYQQPIPLTKSGKNAKWNQKNSFSNLQNRQCCKVAGHSARD
jgi:tetratricopeptide (TPR) repeat protein